MFFLKKTGYFLKEFLFPKFCLGCGRVGLYICDKCQKEIKEFDNTKCFYCGKKTLFGLTHSKCLKIDRFNGFLSLYKYNWLLKKIIKNFKYRLAFEIWEELAKIINFKKLSIIKKWGEIDYLQPVPIERKRINKRGFNQAFMIAQYFNYFLNLAPGDFLIKKSISKSQAVLTSKKERKKNIKNSFIVINKENLFNKNILLVDDIITTGSTVEEIILNLRKFGAKNIFVLTLAKG